MTEKGFNLAKGIEYTVRAEDREGCFNERSRLNNKLILAIVIQRDDELCGAFQ